MVGARRHVFQNAPKSAKEFYATLDPSDSGGASAHWRPEFASASAAGDFGFTTEPFSGEDTAFGYCLTVLCQQPNPDWRWIYEGGLDTPDRTKRIAPLMSSSSPPLSRGESAADLAQSAVAAFEPGLAANAAADAPASLGAQFDTISRVPRQNQPPAVGAETIAAALKAGPHVSNFSQLRSYAAAAGDMLFTLREARRDGGNGIHGRIKSDQADGWRLTFDQIVPC